MATDVAGSRGVACEVRALSARAAFVCMNVWRSRTVPEGHVTGLDGSVKRDKGSGGPEVRFERRHKAPPKQPVDTARAKIARLCRLHHRCATLPLRPAWRRVEG